VNADFFLILTRLCTWLRAINADFYYTASDYQIYGSHLNSDGLVIWINVKNNRPSLFWKPPDVLTLKWNVDGSSKGKQGLQVEEGY
jgi:hypothetical protein